MSTPFRINAHSNPEQMDKALQFHCDAFVASARALYWSLGLVGFANVIEYLLMTAVREPLPRESAIDAELRARLIADDAMRKAGIATFKK